MFRDFSTSDSQAIKDLPLFVMNRSNKGKNNSSLSKMQCKWAVCCLDWGIAYIQWTAMANNPDMTCYASETSTQYLSLSSNFPQQFYKQNTETSETIFNDKLNFFLHALFYLAGVFNINDFLKIHVLFKYKFRHNTTIFWLWGPSESIGPKEENTISPKTNLEKPQQSSTFLRDAFTKKVHLNFLRTAIQFLISSSSSGNSETSLQWKQKF